MVREDFEAIKQKNLVNPQVISRLYGIPLEKVTKVVYFDPAKAIKIVLGRSVPSGSPGDRDVYGAQQHAPLLDLEVDI
jgi:hypothetical protein